MRGSTPPLTAEEATGRYRVPIFNPGSNSGQQSRLRLINPTDSESDVTITGVDDAGVSAPEGDVHLTLAAGEARTITAQQLESGDDDLTGRLGDGAGKWTLFVSTDQSTQVMSLMLSGDGNLSNLSRTPYYETHGAPTVSLRIADAGASEGEPLVFTVTLDLTPASTETYYYATYGATAGSEDYTGHSATELQFGAGERSSTITVRTTQDAQVEGDEAFYVYVTNSPGDLTASTPTSYLVRATGTIRDDDVDIAAACPGSTVSIPDLLLRRGIEQALGKAPDAPITPAEMATVTRLRYPNELRLTSLTGLECATGLTELKINGAQITDVSPLAGLLALRTLGLASNQITDVSPLAGLLALQFLGLSNNQITDVSPLAGLLALRTLYLSNNQITDVSPLAGLLALRTLYLSSNQITDVSPLAGLPALQFLHLRSNQITDIAPLVSNMGLGFGDVVFLRGNPLSTDSLNTHIPALEARGVRVHR